MHTRSCFQPGCSGVPRCSWHSLFPCCSKPHSPAPPGSLPVCCFSVQEKHPQNCKTHTFSHNPLHHPISTTKIFYCVPRLTQNEAGKTQSFQRNHLHKRHQPRADIQLLVRRQPGHAPGAQGWQQPPAPGPHPLPEPWPPWCLSSRGTSHSSQAPPVLHSTAELAAGR